MRQVGRRLSGRVGIWIALTVCLAGLPALFRAQVKPAAPVSKSPQQAFILRSATNVVLVDVRVYDKSGKPVTDLKQSDFRVTEDGVQQTVSSFSLEDVEKLSQANGANEKAQVIDLAKLPPEVNAEQVLQDHRLLVFFFDLSSMQPDELMRALKASGDFVTNKMTPADLIAVVTYSSSLRVTQDFTNDRLSLRKALRAILVGEESSSVAAQGAIGAAGGTDANGMEIVTQDVSDAFTPDETEFNIFNTDEKLAAVQSLATMLRNVPGRKSVIHFSSGITKTGQENEATLRAATDAANQADVSLYTMDARGLAALPPGGDASSSSPSGTALYSGSAVASQVSSLQGSRETLATLATDTGGRTFYDLNDFTPAFDEVQRENSSYYLIGYTPHQHALRWPFPAYSRRGGQARLEGPGAAGILCSQEFPPIHPRRQGTPAPTGYGFGCAVCGSALCGGDRVLPPPGQEIHGCSGGQDSRLAGCFPQEVRKAGN